MDYLADGGAEEKKNQMNHSRSLEAEIEGPNLITDGSKLTPKRKAKQTNHDEETTRGLLLG